MIYKEEKLHTKYVVNINFDGVSPQNYLQTTEMGSLMRCNEIHQYLRSAICKAIRHHHQKDHQVDRKFRPSVRMLGGLCD